MSVVVRLTVLDIYSSSDILVPSTIQASHIVSPHNTRQPYHGLSDGPNRVTDFAALTGQDRALIEHLRQEKYANIIARLDNVE